MEISHSIYSGRRERTRTAEVHMEQGPIGKTLLLFTGPVLLSQLLQQMYSAADCMIVGHFGGANGLAAAGEASLLLSVIINFFVGFSTGVSAITGAAYGSRDYEKLRKILRAVVFMSIGFGAAMTALGVFFSRELLVLINCPQEIADAADLYLRICMLGIIPQFLYNMGNAVLRSLGNTKEPLYFLLFSSLLNLVLDVLFVVGLSTGLPGAGAATVLSQWALAAVMVWKMTRLDPQYALRLERWGRTAGRSEPEALQRQSLEKGIQPGNGADTKALWNAGRELRQILKTGLPSGMQAIFMSISSMVIQTSINSFGADAAAGMVVFARVESFLYYVAFSYGMALTGFIGQNYGAGRIERVREGMKIGMLHLVAFTVAAGALLMACAPTLLGLFTADAAIAWNGLQAIRCIFPFYFLYSINQIYIGGLRGLGKTGYPMLCALICYCIFRVAWCQALLPVFGDIRVIYFSYDASWVLMLALQASRYQKIMRGITQGA